MSDKLTKLKEAAKKAILVATGVATLSFGAQGKTKEDDKNKNNQGKKVSIAQIDGTSNNQGIPKFLTDPAKNKPKDKKYIKNLDPRNERLINDTWPEYSGMIPGFESFFGLTDSGRLKYSSGESRCTIGYGNTYTFLPAGNNVFYQYECQDHSSKGRPDSPMAPEIKAHYKNNDKNWFMYQAKLHLMLETLPILRNKLARYGLPAPEKLPKNVLWALLITGYQRDDYDAILPKFKTAQTIQDKANAFSYFGSQRRLLRGSWDRRYWLGLLAAGKVTIKQLNSFPIDGFSELGIQHYVVNKSETWYNGTMGCKFKVDDETIKKNIQIVKKVKAETITNHMKNFDQSQKTKVTKGVDKTAKSVDIRAGQVKAMMADAHKSLKDKKYKEATSKYEAIIAKDKNNSEAYSDLTLAYIKLAENSKTSAEKTKYYEASCKNARLGLRSNPDINTSAYLSFNAGLAREGLAKHYATNKNFSKAEEQYHKAKINYDNAFKTIPNKVYSNARDNAESEAYRIRNMIRQMNKSNQRRR